VCITVLVFVRGRYCDAGRATRWTLPRIFSKIYLFEILAELNEDESSDLDAARAKADAESATKKTDSNQEPNIKETDVRVESVAAAAAGAGAGREEKQEKMIEVKSSELEGQHY